MKHNTALYNTPASGKRMISVFCILTALLFLPAAVRCLTVRKGGLRTEISRADKTCTVFAGDAELIRFTFGLASQDRADASIVLHAETSGGILTISGKTGNAPFSGWFIPGNKGTLFCFRCYAGSADADLFEVRVSGGTDFFARKKQDRYSCNGYTVILNSFVSFTEPGRAVLKPYPLHFTGGREGGLIWGGIVKRTCPLPVLIEQTDESIAAKKNIPFTMGMYIIDSVDNPYTYTKIACAFTGPSNDTVRIQPFFTQDVVTDNKTVSEKGCPYFAFRFCPREKGKYRYTVTAGKRRLRTGGVSAADSEDPGFVRSSTGSRYFFYDNGEVFFPVGLNVAWADNMTAYIDTCAANGINLVRLWLCTWGLNIEGRELYDYRLDMCRRLDTILRYAQKKNVYIMLCINNFHDFKYNKEKHGYFGKNGPCRTDADFFTNPRCLRIHKDFLQYLVNRYSAYPSLLCWELWNEINYAIDSSDAAIHENQNAMAVFIKSADPFKHPVTTSLGWNSIDYDLWDLKSIDIIQFHSYVPEYPLLAEYSNYLDIAGHIQKNSKDFERYAKPVLLAEIGHNGTEEHNMNNDLDPEGIMLHNSLWASSLSGFSGSAMHWWWDVYIDRNGLYYHFLPLSRLLSEFDITPGTKPLGSEHIYNGRVRIMALKNKTECLLWVQDKKATWGSMRLKSYRPAEYDSVRLRIGMFRKGTYSVTWLNTYSGAEIRSEKIVTDKSMLFLTVPPFTRDTACLIQKYFSN